VFINKKLYKPRGCFSSRDIIQKKGVKSAVKLSKDQPHRLSTDYESVKFIFNSFVFSNGAKYEVTKGNPNNA